MAQGIELELSDAASRIEAPHHSAVSIVLVACRITWAVVDATRSPLAAKLWNLRAPTGDVITSGSPAPS